MTGTWSINVRPDSERLTLINANHRTHWSRRADLARQWRANGWNTTQHIPRLDKAHITIEFAWPDNRHRDVGNLAPTAKAWVDGAVNGPFKGHRFGPGLLPDDDDQHLVGPDLRRGPRTHREPLIFITIMELT